MTSLLRKDILTLFLGSALALTGTPSQAGSWKNGPVTLHGFGTLGVSYSDQGDADFSGNLFHPNGAGHTRRLAGSVDSKLGLQLRSKFTETWSSVVQAVSRYRHDGSYSPDLEWAYVQYQPTPTFSVRAGRIVNFPFMETQTRLVSYSYIWVRPPRELYDLNPITNKTGFDIQYHLSTGAAVNYFTASWGVANEDFATGGSVDVDSAWEFEYRLEYHNTTLRLAFITAEADITIGDLESLADGFEDFAGDSSDSNRARAFYNAHILDSDDAELNIVSAGFLHQPGNWLLRGEIARVSPDKKTYLSAANGGYLTAGYRIANITPFVTAAMVSSDRKSTRPLDTDGMSMEQAAIAEQLNMGLESAIDEITTKQRSVSAGTRWDLHPNVALKFQYTHLKTDSGSNNPGRLVEVQPGFEPGDSVDILSITMDFVF